MPKKIYSTRTKSKVAAKYRMMSYGFVSGTMNKEGVGVRFYALESGECAAPFKLTRFHEGHKMLAHGGVTAAILDETMGYANHVYEFVHDEPNCFVFTGTATYEYLVPVPIEKDMLALAKVVEEEGRVRHIYGEIIDENGLIYVRSKAIYVTSKSLENNDVHIDVGMLPLEEGDPEEM